MCESPRLPRKSRLPGARSHLDLPRARLRNASLGCANFQRLPRKSKLPGARSHLDPPRAHLRKASLGCANLPRLPCKWGGRPEAAPPQVRGVWGAGAPQGPGAGKCNFWIAGGKCNFLCNFWAHVDPIVTFFVERPPTFSWSSGPKSTLQGFMLRPLPTYLPPYQPTYLASYLPTSPSSLPPSLPTHPPTYVRVWAPILSVT